LKALNEFATTIALDFLKIVCEFPFPRECFVFGKKKQSDGSGTINTPHIYPPVASTNSLVHDSSSISPPQTCSGFIFRLDLKYSLFPSFK